MQTLQFARCARFTTSVESSRALTMVSQDPGYPAAAALPGSSSILLDARDVLLCRQRELFNVGTCERFMVPLRLAWALTIHKSLGDANEQSRPLHATPVSHARYMGKLRGEFQQ